MATSDELIFFKRQGYFKYPKYLQVEITDFCPLHCRQCYKKETDHTFLSLEKFIDIINMAKSMEINNIIFNGGEPFAHKDFIQMVKYCDNNNINSTVFTSGYNICKESCNLLKNSSLNIQVSLNASKKDLNDQSRDGYDYAVKAMKTLQKHCIKYGINWVARHDNIMNLPDLIKFSNELGAKDINIVCNKLTNGKNLVSPMTKEDYIFLKKVIMENSEFCKVQSCYGILLSYLGAPNNRLYGCQAGIRLMAITAEGKYMPCTHLHYTEEYDSIYNYWTNSSILKKLRNIEKLEYCEKCKKCRVCHSISKEAYDDFTKGFKECPLGGIDDVCGIKL